MSPDESWVSVCAHHVLGLDLRNVEVGCQPLLQKWRPMQRRFTVVLLGVCGRTLAASAF